MKQLVKILDVNKKFYNSIKCLCLLIGSMLYAQNYAFAEAKYLCIYDTGGTNGPVYNQMQDYRTVALAWNVEFNLKPYTDERIAAEDFKAGLCDAIVVTGFKVRDFNSFTGTLDAIGALPSYKHVKTAFQTLSSPKAAKLMQQGAYEVGGIIPAGAAYLFVKDREVRTIQDLSGKRIGVLDIDPSQREMALLVGGSPVGSDIARLYSNFNNGALDVVSGPAIVYEAMEVYKGLKPKGGVVDFPLGQLSLQLVFRTKKFPDGFGQQSREYIFSEFDRALSIIKSSEEGIPKKWWIEIPPEDRTGYIETLRQARISLKKKNIYNGKTLTVMRKIRCNLEPGRSECTAVDRE